MDGAMVCLGLLVGWQALPLVTAWILLTTLLAGWILKNWTPWRAVSRARQPIVWAWLGFVFFRATWKSGYLALHGLGQLPAWSLDMLPLILVFPLACWLVARDEKTDGKTSHLSHVDGGCLWQLLVMLQCGGLA